MFFFNDNCIKISFKCHIVCTLFISISNQLVKRGYLKIASPYLMIIILLDGGISGNLSKSIMRINIQEKKSKGRIML